MWPDKSVSKYVGEGTTVSDLVLYYEQEIERLRARIKDLAMLLSNAMASGAMDPEDYTILKRRVPLKGHPDYGIMWDGQDIVTDTPIYLRLHEIKWNPGESVETRNSGSC